MKKRESDKKAHELGRWKKKVADQQKQIDALKAEVEASFCGMRELSAVTDSVLISLALRYGEARQDGGSYLSIPLVSVRQNLRDYAVSADISSDNAHYDIAVRRRPKKAVPDA